MGDWYVSVLHKHNQSICKHLNTNIYVIPSYLLSIVEYRDHRIRENVNDMQFFLHLSLLVVCVHASSYVIIPQGISIGDLNTHVS